MGIFSRHRAAVANPQLEAVEQVETHTKHIVKPVVRPRATRFSQQYIPGVQPSYHPGCAAVIFLIVFLAFVPVGIVFLVFSSTAHTVEVRYDEACGETLKTENIADPFGRPYCESVLDFTVPQRLSAPVYISYRITRFYLNHRVFGESRDDRQIMGMPDRDLSATRFDACEPFQWVGEEKDWPKPSSSDRYLVYNPCGAVAHATFNDSFVLSVPAGGGTVLCTSVLQTALCKKRSLTLPANRWMRYKQDPRRMSGFHSWPNDYAEQLGHMLPNVNDEDTMSWMNQSPSHTLLKLWRILDADLEPGVTYRLAMQQRFPVEEFGGSKSLVFTTTSWAGGRNQAVGIVMIVFGTLCGALALAMCCVAFLNPREPGDVAAAIDAQ
eukprot:TRINITY_DN12399_c0_g1_i1.p1 TRINITY_DN12399_c0_g1~~TRINITY_DN12399_c0_g1_i1.p1  ORF type:complete len:381 (+),score=52.10 TRINITY_DN12399_c0_g1_i1:190-1332(+)